MLEELEIPEWVTALLTEKFFNSCLIHEEEQKNDKTFLCLDCAEGICSHCLPNHTSHRLLKIRRYVYLDVVRVNDGDKVMDCSKIQPYITNGAKVVFLKQKPFSRPPSVNAKQCLTCDRNLHEPYCYCSICCKVEHLLEKECNLLKCFCKSDNCVSEPGSEDGQITPDSVLGMSGSARTESGSVTEMAGTGLMDCTATTLVKKKRTIRPRAMSSAKPVCVSASDVSKTKPIYEPVCDISDTESVGEMIEAKPICEPVVEISETESEPVGETIEAKPICEPVYEISDTEPAGETIEAKPVRNISEQVVSVNKRKGMPHRSPLL